MALTVEVQLGRALASVRRTEQGAMLPPAPKLRALLTRGVRAALTAEGHADAEISVTLVPDRAMADMNRRFLDHAGPTDVIAFALFEPGARPVGDVYVGVEQALRQAAAHGVRPSEELVRLAVHGTLHVLGHDHPEGPERVRSSMWRLQEALVNEVTGT